MSPPMPLRGLSRLLWMLAGTGLFALGAVGAVTPLLPTTVFWIGAVACFARSHPPLAERILAHPRYGPPLRRYRDHGVIDARGKRAALLAIAVSGGITALVTRSVFVTLAACACLCLVALYIATRPEVPPSLAEPAPDAAARRPG